MIATAKLGRAAAAVMLIGLGLPQRVRAQQEHPVQRVANIVSVSIEEYGKGVDERGRLISADEYQEAIGFLHDARDAALRLPGERAVQARAVLDSIILAVAMKRPPSSLVPLGQRFTAALGSEAALELPTKPLNVADGAKLFAASCASCHGTRGLGDGPAAAAINPKPPSIGSAAAMQSVAPAMAFRKMSVGVTGTAMPAFATTLTAEQRWNVVMYLEQLRTSSAQVAEGEGLYTRGCASCHGVAGLGDGAVERSLTTLPPELGSFAWQADRSDSQLVAAVRAGIPGSPMPPSSELSDAEARNVVAYLRTLPMRQSTALARGQGGRGGEGAAGAAAAASASLSLLEQSLTAARDGRTTEASDRAFDAYLAFEPIESPARARDPGVVSSMERQYADFKAAIRDNDLQGAARARDAIGAGMERVVSLTRPAGSGSEAFFQSLLIILREGFEAILVIGAVVAFLLKTGHRERLKSIWWGIALALVASALTAVVLRTVLGAIPASQEIIEGLTLLIAVCVLFSVSYWLISRVEAARWQQFIREKVNTALDHGGGRALAFVAFLAVYREGAETALFYQALFNEGAHVALPIALGIIVGLALLVVIFTLFYRFGVRIPLRPFFSVTSVLLYYMAFVFVGKGIRELQEGNAVPISVIPGFPTIEALGIYATWQTLLAQFILLALFVFAVAKTFWPKRSVALPTVTPTPAVAPDALLTELAALRGENVQLKNRVEAIEAVLQRAEKGAEWGANRVPSAVMRSLALKHRAWPSIAAVGLRTQMAERVGAIPSPGIPAPPVQS